MTNAILVGGAIVYVVVIFLVIWASQRQGTTDALPEIHYLSPEERAAAFENLQAHYGLVIEESQARNAEVVVLEDLRARRRAQLQLVETPIKNHPEEIVANNLPREIDPWMIPLENPKPLVATKVETFRWSPASSMVGLILEEDGVRLPGLFAVSTAMFDCSFDNEFKRYATSYCWIEGADPKGKGGTLKSGPWAVLDYETTKTAVQAALA